jgi:hypothetical protein
MINEDTAQSEEPHSTLLNRESKLPWGNTPWHRSGLLHNIVNTLKELFANNLITRNKKSYETKITNHQLEVTTSNLN